MELDRNYMKYLGQILVSNIFVICLQNLQILNYLLEIWKVYIRIFKKKQRKIENKIYYFTPDKKYHKYNYGHVLLLLLLLL